VPPTEINTDDVNTETKGGEESTKKKGRAGTVSMTAPAPRWSTWAHNLAMLSALCLILGGGIDSVWGSSSWADVRMRSSRPVLGCFNPVDESSTGYVEEG
jgi:hypothetical protein